jgi:hypothetical protein
MPTDSAPRRRPETDRRAALSVRFKAVRAQTEAIAERLSAEDQ